MSDFLNRIVLWIKVAAFVAVGVFVILVLAFNWGTRVNLDLVFGKYEQVSLLLVLFLTAIFSVLTWWLIRTVYKTVRQVRESRERARTSRLEKEVADMKAKAAMLKTRPDDPKPEA